MKKTIISRVDRLLVLKLFLKNLRRKKMKRKIIFNLLITVFSVFAFAGTAFAAQNVVLKTTVPDIPKSTCYQAGTDTWELDNATVLTNGDVISLSLSNNTTLCKSFDYYLRLHDGLAPNCAALPLSTAADPVTSTLPVWDNLVTNAPGLGVDYGFLVQGTAGAQTFTMTVVERDTVTGIITFANPFTLTFTTWWPADRLIVKFFDGKFGAPYFWKDDPAIPGADYSINTIAEDNAICIDTLTQNFPGEYVERTPDSLPNLAAVPPGIPLVFSGDYRIAHIVAIERTELSECKGAQVGHIRIGDTVAQAADTCDAFNFETAGTGFPGNGYCTDHNGFNRLIIHSMDAPFVLDNYELRLEILVNGLTGDRGVYFSNVNPLTAGDPTLAGACAAMPGAAIGAKTMFLADGVTISAGAAAIADCTIAAADRAVILTTAGHNMNLAAGDDYMLINLPPFNYNLASINEGDVVTIRVTLNRLPCGTIGPHDIIIGTFGCDIVPVANWLRYPYFTNFDSTAWWNGIVVDNLSAAAGTAITLYLFEKDGDIGQAVVAVDPQSQYVALLSNITWTVAVAGGSGVIGDVSGYIIACTDFVADGFAMIANDNSGESMGYLPRTNIGACPVVIP